MQQQTDLHDTYVSCVVRCASCVAHIPPTCYLPDRRELIATSDILCVFMIVCPSSKIKEKTIFKS